MENNSSKNSGCLSFIAIIAGWVLIEWAISKTADMMTHTISAIIFIVVLAFLVIKEMNGRNKNDRNKEE